ncbi:MAG: hypothetical protein KBD65_01875 [Candidatus Moranbacteria bacterium]|nr:hypothetical protein [Candidatus Moranbacteria bacterium]
MSLELPTEEWKQPRENFHLDPKKQDPENSTGLAAHVQRQEIVRQIGEAELEDLDGVLDRLSEAVLQKPELGDDPDYKAKLEAAHKRLQELMRGTLH